MDKFLVFVAAGNSTRMGGVPKALSLVDNVPIIINTIKLALPYYDRAYVVSNAQNKQLFEDAISSYSDKVSVFDIVSGQGDADAVLKAIKHIESIHPSPFDITFCWGDAFFVDESVFRGMMGNTFEADIKHPILVGCSIDEDPYAYFDICTEHGDLSGMLIQKSYFKKRDGAIALGMHDQCIFRANSKILKGTLLDYQKYLEFDGYHYCKAEKDEMGLLNSFDFFASQHKYPVVRLLPSKKVYSFNTIEELNKINSRCDE